MSPGLKHCSTLFITTLVLGQLPSIAAASDCKNGIAIAISVQGTIEEKRENLWTPVKRNDIFCAGDTIRVRENSRAIIRLIKEQTNITLAQHTTISFSEQKEKESTWLELLKGAANFISRMPNALKIKTPYVNAAVEGTEFLITTQEGQSQISVFEGHVALSNENGKLDLKSGDTGIAKADQAPAQSLKIDQVDAVQWTMYYPPIISKPKNAPDSNFPSTSNNNDDDPKLLTYYASQFLAVGQLEQAGKNIEKALSIDRADSNALALKSIIAVVKNDKESALKFAKQAVKNDPSAAAHIALSYAHQAHFDLTHALDAAKDATQTEPNNGIAWARLAELWLSQGDLDNALKAAKKATKLNPNLAHTQTILGFSYLTKIKTGKAKKAFEKAIYLDQAAPLPHLGLGLAMIREGYLEQGRIEIEAATSLDPRNSLLRSYVGKAYYEEKRHGLAAKQFTLAKQLDPKDPTPWFYNAILKQIENDPINALKDLQKSIILNDNRSVYRSSLLLDNDEATRSTSQARIYKDLGFEQLSLLEGWKSLSINPNDYSAHRLLADSYSTIPRHEIARVSELLQSQLMQPVNVNPIQPQLAESNLGVLVGAGPSDLAFNEFNPLFLSNGTRFQTNVVSGNNSTIGDDLIVSGIHDNFSYSFGQYYYKTDGFRINNDLEQDIYNLFLQASVNNKLNLQFEYRKTKKDNGDTRINLFDENLFDSSLRENEESDSFRIGANYKLTTSSNLLASISTNSIDLSSPSIGADLERSDDGDNLELVYLNKSETISISSGLSLFNADKTEKLVFKAPFDCTVFDCTPPPTTETIKHNNLFIYSNYIFGNNSIAITGLSFGDIKNEFVDDNFINPKLGTIWNIDKKNTLRLATFKTTKRDLVNSQTLEPTHIAGFNQFFDDKLSAESRLYGIGYDSKAISNFSFGVSYSERTIDFFFEDLTSLNGIDNTEWKYENANIYGFFTISDELTLSTELEHELFKTSRKVSNEGAEKLNTLIIPISLRYFHPSRLATRITLAYVNQEGEFFDPTTQQRTNNEDSFTIFNISVSYRLPKRWGDLSLEIKNLTNKEFKFQDVDTLRPILSPERYVIGKFTLNL